MTRIKICGITSSRDALAAVEAGAAYIGLNFYRPSPRYISPASAREIVSILPPGVVSVGVFVNEAKPADVIEIMNTAGVELAQLHGDENLEYCEAVGFSRVIKVFRLGPGADVESAISHPAASILVDAWARDLYGGTGKTADWELAARISARRPIFLAGGLGVDNLRSALERVAPYAVDLNSGVEISPGVKNRDLMLEAAGILKETAGVKPVS